MKLPMVPLVSLGLLAPRSRCAGMVQLRATGLWPCGGSAGIITFRSRYPARRHSNAAAGPASITIPSGARPDDAPFLSRALLAPAGANAHAGSARVGGPPLSAAVEGYEAETVSALERMVPALIELESVRVGSVATHPGVHFYLPPGEPGEDNLNYFFGLTTPNTAVTLRVLRGAQVVATQTTTSDATGAYRLFPPYDRCSPTRYAWVLQAGDVVEVVAGAATGSTAVVPLVAWQIRRGRGTGQDGSRPPGYSELSQPQADRCLEKSVEKVAFAAPDGSLRGPDGHPTQIGLRTFYVQLTQDEPAFFITTETSDASPSGTVTRNGVTDPLDCQRYSDMYYRCNLQGKLLRAGDVIYLNTNDGGEITLTAPVVTAAGRNDPPSIAGQAPAFGWVDTMMMEIVRMLSDGSSWRVADTYPVHSAAQAGADNRYGASYPGARLNATGSASYCVPARPGSPCASIGTTYCYPEGHTLYWAGDEPDMPGPDVFEDDDSRQQARPYGGPQAHSFDAQDDHDWVRFTVSTETVAAGQDISIETYELGSGAVQWMALYSDGSDTALKEWRTKSMEEQPTATAWTPSAPGIYYLEIYRKPELGNVYCGDVYHVRIRGADTRSIYLPVILQ